MATTKGQEKIRVGKGTCVISWSEMGKEEPICALGTLMYFIEYGEKYSAMPEFFDPAFKRKFESIMKTLKAPSKKGSRCDYTLYQAKRAGRNAVVVFGQIETSTINQKTVTSATSQQ